MRISPFPFEINFRRILVYSIFISYLIVPIVIIFKSVYSILNSQKTAEFFIYGIPINGFEDFFLILFGAITYPLIVLPAIFPMILAIDLTVKYWQKFTQK